MLALAGRVTLCLVAVLGLMWLLARVSRKPLSARAAGPLAVLARQQLSRSTSVAVIRVADKALVVGITDTQVSLLGEADLAEVTEALAPVENVSRTPVDLGEDAGEDTVAARTETADLDLATVADLDDRRSGAFAGSAGRGAFAGSALSPATWKQAIDTLRERTARSS
jgi:flagellar protein FliO/FliZ